MELTHSKWAQYVGRMSSHLLQIPHKYIHGKQTVRWKVGMLLRNTVPQYLSFDIPMSGLKGNSYTKILELDS